MPLAYLPPASCSRSPLHESPQTPHFPPYFSNCVWKTNVYTHQLLEITFKKKKIVMLKWYWYYIVLAANKKGAAQTVECLEAQRHLSRLMRKPTKWHVCPAKSQISLGIRPVMTRLIWSIRWAYMPFCWFCHVAAQIKCQLHVVIWNDKMCVTLIKQTTRKLWKKDTRHDNHLSFCLKCLNSHACSLFMRKHCFFQKLNCIFFLC